MRMRSRPGLLAAVTSALLGFVGCGAPSNQEEHPLQQARQSLSTGPDFVVREVSSAPSAEPGGGLPVKVTVCNQGTVGDSVNLEVFLSADRIISTLDTYVAGTFLGFMEPGQCLTESFLTTASVPEGVWYPGALVDSYANSPESNEMNNGRAGVAVGVGLVPDFVVKSVVGPASARPNEPFNVSVTVCNQGTVGGATEGALVLSQDASIQLSYNEPPETQDQQLISFPIDPLEPEQCVTRQLQALAQPPSEGAWYLGAVADPSQQQPELIRSNNARASALVGLGMLPDFIVQTVAAPASIRPGESFSTSVTVCNQGTEPGDAELQLVLSRDAVIQFSPDATPETQDQPLAMFPSGPLEPGQCSTQAVQSSVSPPQEGGWYLGAVVDASQLRPELIESNNTRASRLTGVGFGPDFIVQSVKGPASVRPNQAFEASVTVCNPGTEPGHADVALVLSQDTLIRHDPNAPPAGQDVFLRGFPAGMLQPGQCVTHQVETWAQPPSEGPWYLGAVVDPVQLELELLEGNNTRASKAMGIGLLPDFIVQAVSGPPSLYPGEGFSAAVTVCNQGTEPGATEVHLVLSEDTDIRFSYSAPSSGQDQDLGYFYSGTLEPGQCKTEPVSAQANAPSDGVWYLGAVADPVGFEQELIENNNTRASEAVGIGFGPDLVVEAVTVPASAAPGQDFELAVTVCNQGNSGGNAEVQLVLSEDEAIHFSYQSPPYANDLPLELLFLGWLEPAECKTQKVQSYAQPPHQGGWYVGAALDPWNVELELLEGNNTGVSKLMGMGYAADLVVQAVVPPASVRPGEPFSTSVTVCNQGTEAGAAEVRLLLSEDTTLRFSPDAPASTQDMPLQDFYSGPLQPGQCATHQVEATVSPPFEGGWYLGAVADPTSSLLELIESNNSRASKLVGIGWAPDFVVQSVVGPPSAEPGQPFNVSVTVCNQGTEAGGTDVQLVLSEDTDIRYSYGGPEFGQDEPLNYAFLSQVQPGQCVTTPVEVAAYAQQEGGWYVGAVVDPGGQAPELIKSNNTRASELIGLGMRPDYVVKAVTGPASAQPGELFTASVTVCNQGTVDGATEVQLVLSEDTDIRFSWQGPPELQDVPLSSVYVSALAPGQCRTEQALVSASPPHPGAWYLGAMADPGQSGDELIESNNTLAGKLVGLGHDADFVIRSVVGPASARPGEPFTARVTVCNQGTTYGASEVQLVLSSDTAIRFSSTGTPEEQDLPVASFHSGQLGPGQCGTQELQPSLSPPTEGGWYLGAVADPFGQLPELIESNNTRASGLIGVGLQPDYIVKAVTVPASARPGEPFSASITVCNQGTVDGGTEVELVLSADTTIRATQGGPAPQEDLPVALIGVGPLGAGRCVTQQQQLSVSPPQEGAWYLGAVADPTGTQVELIDSNNTRASKALGVGLRADLIVQTVTGPASARPGEPFAATVTVCNQGTEPGYADVALVYSQDTDIRFSHSGSAGEDEAVDFVSLGQLAAGQCATEQRMIAVSPPQEGAWYLGAVVDPGSSEVELIENNNSRASAVVGIGLAPDLIIPSVTGPASVRMGEPYGVVVKVCNQGTVSTSAEVQVVLSEDTDIRYSYNAPSYSNDLPIEYLYVEALEPGQCVEQGVALSSWPPQAGGWYVGAVADPGLFLPELIENNNTRASGLVQFQD